MMQQLIIGLTAGWIMTFLFHSHCDGNELNGHWEGAIIMRGSAWPVELDFESTDSGPTASFNIRSMGMIGNPIEVAETDDGTISLEFPYGVGEFALVPADGLIVAHRKLENGRRISLILEKVADYQLPYELKEVEFRSGELTLKGTVFLPKKYSTPRAGVVILHGSKVQGRDSWEYRSWGDFYARLGMVALVYDKRSYEDVYPDLQELATDAKNALACLGGLPQVRQNAIGFFGGSEAGWLTAAVAAESETTPDFVIMSGWPAVTPREQEWHSIERKLRDSDLPNEQVAEALAYLNLYFFHAESGLLWQELLNAAEHATATPWAQYVPIPTKQSEMLWWSRNHGFPTQMHLRQLDSPVLACYGRNDAVVPPARNAELLREILTRSGNQDVSIRIFDEGDHRIEQPFVIDSGRVRWPQLSPDYLHTIKLWLRDRNFTD